jgi:hypothetical protein
MIYRYGLKNIILQKNFVEFHSLAKASMLYTLWAPTLLPACWLAGELALKKANCNSLVVNFDLFTD